MARPLGLGLPVSEDAQPQVGISPVQPASFQREAKPADGRETATPLDHTDHFLILLMEHGGVLDRGSASSVGLVVQQKLGLNRGQWFETKKELEERGLVKFIKVTPEARRIRAAVLQQTTMAEASATGKLSSAVMQAYEELNESQTNEPQVDETTGDSATSASTRARRPGMRTIEHLAATRGETSFLAEGVGNQPAPRSKGLDNYLASQTARRSDAARSGTSKREPKGDDPDSRMVHLSFRLGEGIIERFISVRTFAGLTEQTRTCLAVGMVNDPVFAFLPPERRRELMLTLVNKGAAEKSKLTVETMQDLIKTYTEKGLLRPNGDGPVLTDQGFETTRKSLKKVKTSTIIRKSRNPYEYDTEEVDDPEGLPDAFGDDE